MEQVGMGTNVCDETVTPNHAKLNTNSSKKLSTSTSITLAKSVLSRKPVALLYQIAPTVF